MKIEPRLIIVDREVENLEITKRVCAKFSGIEVMITDCGKSLTESVNQKKNARTIGKSVFYLAKSQGELVKECPGTNNYLCCGYRVVNSIENCSMECSYCILQHYLSDPLIRIHPETERIFSQLDSLLISAPKSLFRIGSGELSDSLLYDHITEFSLDAIEFLKNYRNVLFEFKTKTDNIANLLKIEPCPRNIVVSWTVNTPKIITGEETKTTSLTKRLVAARLCAEKGYKVAFHFDPIIIYPGYLQDYKGLVDKIFQYIKPKNIAWISMGMLRYPPNLQNMIRKRFPRSRIIYGETICGNDGKIRYFKKHRLDTFSAIYRHIDHWAKGSVFVYFCMESPEIWRKVTGFAPADNDEFSAIFNQQLIEKFAITFES